MLVEVLVGPNPSQVGLLQWALFIHPGTGGLPERDWDQFKSGSGIQNEGGTETCCVVFKREEIVAVTVCWYVKIKLC
jgi:hypothetical protein